MNIKSLGKVYLYVVIFILLKGNKSFTYLLSSKGKNTFLITLKLLEIHLHASLHCTTIQALLH